MNFFRSGTLVQKIEVAIFGRSKEQIGKAIGDHAVDFFRHGAIEGTQSRLNVSDGYGNLGANQRCGDRGIYIAVNENDIRLVRQKSRLEALHDLGGLGGMAAGAYSEFHIGFGDFQLREEYVGHVAVIVLAGMNERLTCASLS